MILKVIYLIFRSAHGLYSAQNEYGYPPETLISRSFFDRNTEIFYDYL
ncbi:MAG: hypothetical protein V8S74_11240 [Lachnospirales bacterium]